MTIDDILFSKFSEPARIFRFKNDDTTTVKINNRFLPELGMNMDESEFINSDNYSVYDDDNRNVYFGAIKRCAENDEETECEAWCRLTSNCCGIDRICIRSRFVLLEREEDGYLLYEAIRNVTSERRKFENLQENERKFKITSEQINIYYWEYTVATREMRPCFRCMRDLGVPAVVKNYPEPLFEMGIFPMDYYDMYHDMLKSVEAGEDGLEADIPLTVGRIPFRIKYTVEKDDAGKVYKAFGSATLISETELNKEKLDNSIIEMLSKVYSSIYLADLMNNQIKILKRNVDLAEFDSNITYSDGVKLMMGYFSEEYGESIERFADLNYMSREFFQEQPSREFNFKRQADGKWERASYHAVEWAGDVVRKILVTTTVIDDLRAQKMDADRLIAEQKKELELQQSRLVEAVNAANKANRAKSEFLARMSHEIRTPMNAIMGMNEIIVKKAADSEVRNYAEDAYRAATGLLGTINEILDFSKIESGKMELLEEKFNFNSLLSEIYVMFAMRAEDKGLAFVTDIDASLPRCFVGDEMRIRQVIVNLLSNAVKYTDKGTVTLKVSCKERIGKYAEIRFDVIDTGRGIRKEDMGSLFAPFERIDEKNSKNIEGTGLGMSIVTRLLKMMGSELSVESEYGKGSTFSFTIHQAVEGYEPIGNIHDDNEEKIAADSRPLYQNADGRILVVDDNIINLKVIVALLRDTGINIETVTSGMSALEKTMTQRYDMIFLDHYMPEMDGFETMEALKKQKDGENSSTPVVALTANAIKGAAEEYKAAGFIDVVFKPTTQKELNEILWKYMPFN